MILDNENWNLKVHEWISKYTKTGKLSIVTGYFTVGALAYLSKETLVEGRLGLAIGTDFFSDEETDYKLLKGIDIERYNVCSHRFLKNKENLKWDNAKVFLKPIVLTQRLVAHIENPFPHLKITSCYDSVGIIITNTLMSF